MVDNRRCFRQVGALINKQIAFIGPLAISNYDLRKLGLEEGKKWEQFW